MTMTPLLLASAFVTIVAAGASAQHAVRVPAAPVVPDVHVYRPAPFPAVTWVAPPVLHVPPIPELPPLPDLSRVEEIVSLAMAQKEKAVVFAGNGNAEQFRFFNNSQIENVYSQARSLIDRDQYDRALDPLERVISARGDRADAAMYWKAYSLLKLARREEALSALGQLQKQHPQSRWIGDARALEVEIKQAAGQPVSADALNDDLRLLALQGILRTDPEAAFPVVEKMLMGGASVRVKERALFVLSQNRSERAQQIIGNVARGTSNPDLQLTAIRTLGISNSPDAMNTLTAVYRGDSSVDAKKAVISALASSRNAAATSVLVALARAERNPELKTLMIRHLSNSSAPEAKALMLEILK